MDYTSISVLIVGSYFPMMHYLFQCHPFWKYFYIAFMAILGIIAVILSTSAYFQVQLQSPSISSSA
jgi:predicted membrane channel-forming protein YqfA (hemolysin III family)